jgi:dipeptidyl aminopeptidase/acylaminoacyl peptidase
LPVPSKKVPRGFRAAWLLVVCAYALPAFADDNLTLDDFYSEEGAADVAVSPSGRYVAAVVRRTNEDLLVVLDLETDKRTAITRVGKKDVGASFDARVQSVLWKTDDRLLFRLTILPADGVSWTRLRNDGFRKLGMRLFSISRDGQSLVRLLADNRESALDYALDLGAIRSLLPRDSEHILMVVDGLDGRSLFKVNVITGKGEIVERANQVVWDWWLDLDGKPVVQVQVSNGTLRFYRREAGSRWKKFHSVRLRELKEQNEYEPLGPSDQEQKFYVLARPEGAQRRGIYLYDLKNESFGPAVTENPQFDIFAATISRDGKRVQRYCYVAHVRICESDEAKVNQHMNGVRKYFKDSANIYIYDASNDNEVLLLYVEGPSDPPAYYQYSFATKNISLVGMVQQAMSKKRMPTASILDYAARDGLALNGYLTRPPDAENATDLPLIVMPHGGPEARDHLTFDLFAQYFAARGYAVFQPNYRGSEGFGREFIERGYGEWGRKMQDDITDGVKLLVERKIVDPKRVCIVGASYGGYAALAGAALTPELYRCAVSISGITDLEQFLKARRKLHGADSELYSYWKKQIGDPELDAARIAAVSPAMLIDRITAPILLVHGDADDIVPYKQSQEMKKRLDTSGRKTELITLEDEGHSEWSEESTRRVLTAIDVFVRDKIGSGYVNNRGKP